MPKPLTTTPEVFARYICVYKPKYIKKNLDQNLGKKMALMKLEDIVQHEDVIAKKFSEEKLLKLIFLGGLWNSIAMKT